VDNDDARRRWRGQEAALGGLLVLLGLVVLLGQAVDLEVGRVAWPVLVIVPGLGLLGLGLASAGRLGEVMATVGGVVTMAGLVLGVQNATDRFETWAYAWTLVLVAGAGTGRWLVGVVRGRGGHGMAARAHQHGEDQHEGQSEVHRYGRRRATEHEREHLVTAGGDAQTLRDDAVESHRPLS